MRQHSANEVKPQKARLIIKKRLSTQALSQKHVIQMKRQEGIKWNSQWREPTAEITDIEIERSFKQIKDTVWRQFGQSLSPSFIYQCYWEPKLP